MQLYKATPFNEIGPWIITWINRQKKMETLILCFTLHLTFPHIPEEHYKNNRGKLGPCTFEDIFCDISLFVSPFSNIRSCIFLCGQFTVLYCYVLKKFLGTFLIDDTIVQRFGKCCRFHCQWLYQLFHLRNGTSIRR